MACNCNNDKTNCYNISMGCVVPALANPNAYYTKSEVDEKLEDIIASGCCITPEEVDEKIESAITDIDLSEYAKKSEIPTVPTNVSAFVNDVPYLTEHQSLSGYATEQWVQNQHYITGVDLSDYATKEYVSGYTYDKETIDEKVAGGGSFDPTLYYTKEEVDAMLDDKATKTWVLNQHFVTNSEFIQYIQNLQNQITQLQVEISGCCGGGGETIYRWITMTGENDYVCSGTTKYTKEKEQTSTDGVNWTDTGIYRQGSTILEENSEDCGYVVTFKFKGVLRNSNVVELPCDSSTILTESEVHNSRGYSSIQIGNCITEIGEEAFQNEIHIDKIVIPSNVKTIGKAAFADAGNASTVSALTITLNEGLTTIGSGAFFGCRKYSSLVIPNSVTTVGSSAFYMNNITNLTIGSGVTTIGQSAFSKSSGATQYEVVTVLATTPPILEDYLLEPFKGTFPIYVPSESVNAYKTSQYWSAYADRIFPNQ